MNLSRRVIYVLAAATLVLALLVVAVQFTGLCELEAVTLDGQSIDDWRDRLGLQPERSVVRQPLDSLARTLLGEDDIRKVDIRIAIPGRLDILTNRFDPVCFVLSEKTGKLYGLDREARVIEVPETWLDWEHPVLVNAGVEQMFEPCRDVRVPMVLADLTRLVADHTDLYRVIAEIDFGNADHLDITIAGLPCRLWVTAGSVYDQLERFVRFIYNFSPDLDSTRIVDLRFENQIVCSTKGRRNGR